MRTLIFFLLMLMSLSGMAQEEKTRLLVPVDEIPALQKSDFSQAKKKDISKMTCEELLEELENNPALPSSEYDKCGFNDSYQTWEKWAGFVTVNQMKRALYEICIRYPEHEYHDMYCERSAGFNYGPALFEIGKKAFQENDFTNTKLYFSKALQAGNLTQEQEGNILAFLGAYYVQQNDIDSAKAYLEKASQKRSALANNILGVFSFANAEETLEAQKPAFEYFWKAILLDCPMAQENLGLFHLVRQGKLKKQEALLLMKQHLTTCEPTKENKSKIDEDLLACQCRFVLSEQERLKKKSYVLTQIEGVVATLQKQTGEVIKVSKGDVLDNGMLVSDVRKTAVILTKGTKEREVLNLFSGQKCVTFCQKHHIQENLSPADMYTRASRNDKLKVRPYHLTFTPQECEVIAYYAPQYVDVSLPYVGKEECAQTKQASQAPKEIEKLLQAKDPEKPQEADTYFLPRADDQTIRTLTDAEKERLMEMTSMISEDSAKKKSK